MKYAICNADESEPGTFKDRQLLAEQPHLVLEGLLMGMVVTGAEEGWVFIRHEYGPEESVLYAEVENLREQGLIGEDVLGTGRRLMLDIFTSPGGYILGEETALIECMEGHRGEPRNKPPFPGVFGLWGKPTLMNSVETFADVPIIVARGAQWWKDQGVNGSEGLKFFAVSGHVEKPGVYCVPMGTTIRDLLDLAGGCGRRCEPRVGATRRGLIELPGPRASRRSARLRHDHRRRLDAGVRSCRRARRGHRLTGCRDQRAAVLPQRVVRQVRPLPGRFHQGIRPADRHP